MLGVYVHLPFCPYLCPYCDFAKWPWRASASAKYLAALRAEIEREPRVPAGSIYLGGGTPNAYDRSDVVDLLSGLRDRFFGARETTIEVNPELVRDGDFEYYRAAGVTRVSIGVQSFVPEEIRRLGRKHTVEQIGWVVAAARAAQFHSVSLDLMFAVPGQTTASWRKSLSAAIALDVDHISAYGLTVEEGTPYAAWQAREPQAFCDDRLEAELYATAIATLRLAGYEQYEISSFARPGHQCTHNLNYWANGEYIGLGVGAASYRDGVRSTHTRSLEQYVDAAREEREIPAQAERLEGKRRAGEAVMLALRTAQGVCVSDFKKRYGVDVIEDYAPVVTRFARTGMLERVGDAVRLTEQGRFFANDVCGAFLTSE
jgi:oxygen-independent coproporphyrinogen-3 oxidase